jgi:hypothetical protein
MLVEIAPEKPEGWPSGTHDSDNARGELEVDLCAWVAAASASRGLAVASSAAPLLPELRPQPSALPASCWDRNGSLKLVLRRGRQEW